MFDVDTIELAAGRHELGSGQASFMEAVSYFAGEEWSDRPECVSPMIATFGNAWNDALPDGDRTPLLRPYIRRVAGTRCPVDLSQLGVLGAYARLVGAELKDVACMPVDCTRAWMCADWLIRTYTPACLRLAGKDTTTLEELPEIVPDMGGFGLFSSGPLHPVIMNAIAVPQQRAERNMPWLGFGTCASRAEALTGAGAALAAFKAVPTLSTGAPGGEVADIVRFAKANALGAMEMAVHAAAGDAGWNDALEGERRVTLAMARDAARRASREIERSAPAEVRRAARDAKRAAPRPDRYIRKSSEGAARRSAEATVQHTARRAVRPYVWIRAKAAGWAAVRDSRKAVIQYAPPAIRDAAQAAATRAYHDVENSAHWQPTLAEARAAAQHALAPTITELQNSACDLLERLTTA